MKFIPIRSYDNYVPANIDLGLLKEHGVEGWLKDEATVTVNPVLGNAVGGIKLMVLVEQAQEAVEILERQAAAYQAKLVCPNCGSKMFRSFDVASKPTYWLESVMAFFLGKSILGKERLYYCSDCQTQFKEPAMGEPAEPVIPD